MIRIVYFCFRPKGVNSVEQTVFVQKYNADSMKTAIFNDHLRILSTLNKDGWCLYHFMVIKS